MGLLDTLDKHDPLEKDLSVNEDILGVYRFDVRGLFDDEKAVNRATIHLYWGVIGWVSELLGCDVEDLTIVVLTHELAHAYTQLAPTSRDVAGRRPYSPRLSWN